MSTRESVLRPAEGVTVDSSKRRSRAVAERARPEARHREGMTLVVAGWIVAVVGVVLYCAACFAADTDADLATILLHGTIPAARAALGVVGGGTLLWIVGSVVHANAVLDGADDGDGDGGPGREGEARRSSAVHRDS